MRLGGARRATVCADTRQSAAAALGRQARTAAAALAVHVPCACRQGGTRKRARMHRSPRIGGGAAQTLKARAPQRQSEGARQWPQEPPTPPEKQQWAGTAAQPAEAEGRRRADDTRSGRGCTRGTHQRATLMRSGRRRTDDQQAGNTEKKEIGIFTVTSPAEENQQNFSKYSSFHL